MENFTIVGLPISSSRAVSFLSFALLLHFTCWMPSTCINLRQLHDMNIHDAPWSTPLLLEANKFWFYAISASIMASLLELFSPPAQTTKSQNETRESKSEKTKSTSNAPPTAGRSRTALLTRIVVDACDLALPASFLGWTSLGDMGVGVAMVVSTVLAGREEWVRAQGVVQV